MKKLSRNGKKRTETNAKYQKELANHVKIILNNGEKKS